jgi:YegS/Rv2252/BmrU family lipid kinase
MHFTPESDPWLFIVNPAAGGGKAGKKCTWAETLMISENLAFVRKDTREAGDAEILVREAILLGFRKILVGGGDGTLNEVIKGIMSEKSLPPGMVLISQLPVGTGNDWRKSYGLDTKLTKAIQLLKSTNHVMQDVGKITYTDSLDEVDWFINSAGCGFDAHVAFAANEKKKQGKSGVLTYIRALITELFNFKEPEMHVVSDGEMSSFKAFTVLAGLGKFAGNGMKLIPHARGNSGCLYIVKVKKISRFKVIINIHRLFNGSFTRLREVETLKCRQLEMYSRDRLKLQIDGESRGSTPVRIEVVPNAFRVLVP